MARRIALAVPVLAALIVLGAVMLAKGLSESETFRAGVVADAREDFGLEIELGALDIGLLPPRVTESRASRLPWLRPGSLETSWEIPRGRSRSASRC